MQLRTAPLAADFARTGSGSRRSIVAAAIRQVLAGSLCLGSGMGPTEAAEHPGLPISVNQQQEVGLKIPDLTKPALHPGADVGRASGTYSADGRSLTVDQTTAKAILDWGRFDIAAGNAVRFNQPGAAAVALNHIHQSDPSRIFGALTANGQVYLINQNGFLFGKGAQIDTNSLVVSTLTISDDTFAKGITKVVDTGPAGSREPVAALTGDGRTHRPGADGTPEKIAIRIEKGATLKGDGGRVLLAAPAIENRGVVRAGGGQAILAAATDKVYLQEADPESDLRGLLVEVKTGGSIDNLGKVIAERGNSTLVGFAIRQQGLVSASTTVALGGSVRLLARENASLKADGSGGYTLTPGTATRGADAGDGLGTRASVTLEKGSRTVVSLDDSGGGAVDAQSQPHSRVDVEAGRVVLRSGSTVRAKGGGVSLLASDTPSAPLAATSASNGSRIIIEKGATVDVSGSRRAEVAMERNVVKVDLRDNDLRDAPLQKDGVLHGETVAVDVRSGTPLADISGATARIRRSVYERNAEGGRIELASEGDVRVARGAELNVSGGQVRYRDGYINTSKLLADGRVYDIAEADPDRTYQGLADPVGQGRFERGYVDGYDAGGVTAKARELAFAGNVRGGTVSGPYQRSAERQPDGGSLAIDTAWSRQLQQEVRFAKTGGAVTAGEDEPFPRDAGGLHPAPLVLGMDLFKAGLRHLLVNSMGTVTLPESVDLRLAPGSSLDLTGGALELAGSIRAPAGSVKLATQQVAGAEPAGSGTIHLAPGAVIDTSGLWVNDSTPGADTSAPVLIDAGSIGLQALGDLLLEPGSRLLADGGAWLRKNLSMEGGRGGDISLVTEGLQPTRLELGARVEGYGFTEGGSLSVTANAITVAEGPASGGGLTFDATLLEDRGFGAIALTANAGDLIVTDGLRLDLRQRNLQLDVLAWQTPSAANARGVATPSLLPQAVRKPVDLSLNLEHSARVGDYRPDHELRIGSGTAIMADSGAAIDLVSDSGIRVDGTLSAPAGHIGLTLAAPTSSLDRGYLANQAIRLGDGARLLAQGTTVLEPNNRNLRLGEVLSGGDVELTARRGSVLMADGAVIDVSGSRAELDVQSPDGGYRRQTVGSAAGRIVLTAAETLIAEGRLKGAAGAQGLAGGSLTVALDANARAESEEGSGFPTSPRVLHLSQSAGNRLGSVAGGDTLPAEWNGQGYVSADQIEAGGFSSLNLAVRVQRPGAGVAVPQPAEGEIRFDGGVKLATRRSIELDAPALSWGSTEAGRVELASSYLALGSRLNRSGGKTVLGGAGSLSAEADWIDLIGATDLQGFATTRLSSRVDLRMTGVNPDREQDLVGSLVTGGNLELAADQIYPTTYSRFTVKVDGAANPDGSITLLPGDRNAATPLSAGGSLTLQAPVIASRGVVKAPFGQIAFDAGSRLTLESGSLTSVSGAGSLIPYGRTEGGLDWVFPLGSYQNVIPAPPEKHIELTAPALTVAGGATVDLSGGGDLAAFEFVPGPGGSVDQLDPTDSNYAASGLEYREKYAILPQLASGYAPYDPLEFPASGLTMGDSIYLSGGGGLPAGAYVLLPARYALLPGAYLVTPRAGSTDFVATAGARQLDGAALVAGYRVAAGSGERDARWSGFAVEPGDRVRIRSEYQETTADRFFSNPTGDAGSRPVLPVDAGNLTVAAQGALTLAGDITGQAGKGGRGGELDLVGDEVKVVASRSGQSGTPADGVVVSAEDLNRLDVESLLFGGRRSGTELQVQASSVSVDDGVELAAPEILLAAKDRVVVGKDARITAEGPYSGSPRDLAIGDGEGALLRVSAGDAAAFSRSRATGSGGGSLEVGTGAVLAARGSMLLDATGNIALDGSIAMEGGDLGLSSGRIALGSLPAGAESSGLVLSQDQLDGLAVDRLALHSYGMVDLYGAVDLVSRSLVIDAAGLSGHQAAGETASLRATQSIDLFNSGTASVEVAGGSGTLALAAPLVRFGGGAVALDGYAAVGINAADAVVFSGEGQLDAAADLAITAGKLTADAAARGAVDAGGHQLTIRQAAGSGTASAGLGASLDFRAAAISLDGSIELPAGSLALTADGGLTLGGNARIDAGGRAVQLGDAVALAPGGSVSLTSLHGEVALDAGARIDLAGDPLGGSAGSLRLAAAEGQVTLGGGGDAIDGSAASGYTGGRFSLDSGSALADFSGLNARLQDWGFDGAIAVRQRSGDLTVAAGDRVVAGSVELEADRGRLNVAGVIDTSGADGGPLRLAAGDGLVLASGSQLLAKATSETGKGGRVELQGGGNTGVVAQAGARIDVSGPAEGGTVAVRVERRGGDDAAVDLAGASVTGASAATVEAVETYQAATVGNADIGRWRGETEAYLDAASANAGLTARLGGFRLLPGVEVRSGGDLNFALSERLNGREWTPVGSGGLVWVTTLSDLAGPLETLTQVAADGSVRQLSAATSPELARDGSYYFDVDPDSPGFRQLYVRPYADSGGRDPSRLSSSLVETNSWNFLFPDAAGRNWRFGADGVPGVLTLRAAGDLNLNQGLSDGFSRYDSGQLARFFGVNQGTDWLDTWVLQGGESWSYRLVGGADLAAADALAVQAASAGDLVLGPGVAVRTGTGDIELAAAGDIRFSDAGSTVYTAGRPSTDNRYGSFDTGLVSRNFFVEYPEAGGDVRLTAGGDIVGAASPQLLSGWLQRTGSWNPANGIDSRDRPTAWGVAFDVLVTAGSRDAETLKAQAGFRENVGALGGGNVTVESGGSLRDLSVVLPTSGKPTGTVINGVIRDNGRQVQGGGTLSVTAGGDIAGGVFYVDRGEASLRAGGAINGGSQWSSGPILALGDARLQLEAAGSIDVGAVFNPFALTQPRFTDKVNYFTTYSADSAIVLQSLGGQVRLNNDVDLIASRYLTFDQTSPAGRPVLSAEDLPLIQLYPGSLEVRALSDGIAIGNSLTLYPAPKGQLDLLAAGDIRLGMGGAAVTVNQSDVDPSLVLSPELPPASVSAAARYLTTSVVGGDPRTVHATRPVHADDPVRNRILSRDGSIVGSGGSEIAAAKATVVSAGRDLVNLGLNLQNLNPDDVSVISAGNDIRYPILRDPATGEVGSAASGIRVAGPGGLEVIAGGDIDLGASGGITSVGPLLNSALPADGAALTVVAGSRLLERDNAALEDFLRHYVTEGRYRSRFPDIEGATPERRVDAALTVLFEEIRAAARAASGLSGTRQRQAYQRGYRAIERLFPEGGGDVELFFSRIHTLAGGDIRLLAPHGSVNAGLASAFTGSKSADQLGIVAQRQGHIEALSRGDFQVNQSRVFTLDGGDMTIWSSLGDIDAGRGAKASLAVAPPIATVDAQGNLVVEFPPSVSGSGIRAQSGYGSNRIGDVVLVAPRGVVDAGEAGIGGQNITVVAKAVIGADNIQALGTATGVPQAPTVAVTVPGAANSLVGATAATETSASDAERERNANPPIKPVVADYRLSAQLVGFGQCSVEEVRAGKPGCGG